MAAARKPPRTGGQKPPDGKVRLGQLVMTFGPGAMVDLLDHAVLVGGTDFWRYDRYKDQGFIDEPRLREAIVARLGAKLGPDLSINRAFRLPPAGDDDAPSPYNGIQVAEFPAWFVCQRCRALGQSRNLEREKGRYVHRCSTTQKGVCVPVRFVTTCKRGHLDEFPWNWFVHTSAAQRCDAPDLYLEEDASGDFAHIKVKCRSCQAERPLSQAREPRSLPLCRGDRPWLGPEGREEKGCQEHLSLLGRTASSAYFAQCVSALSIPDRGREVVNKVRQTDIWNVVKDIESREDLPTLRKLVAHVRNGLRDYSDDQVFTAIETVRGGKPPAAEGLRTAEYRVFLEARDEIEGQLPPRDEPFFACRLPPRRHPLPPNVSRVVLAKKVRQVRAQIGLTRLSASPVDLQGETEDVSSLQPLGLTQTWLPAAEIFGEGVLMCLDEDRVREWESRPAVQARQEELEAGYTQEFSASKGPGFPGARFYLLHSLSHLLIASISLQCGYSASALTERIYCAPASDELPMAAIFLMTGTSGAEGTLGGLIEQGRFLERHLRRAWDMASLCSSDPVCAHHTPTDPSGRFLEGAACHGCLFVAEPACERFNRYLDRALVVPTIGHDPALAFFTTRP